MRWQLGRFLENVLRVDFMGLADWLAVAWAREPSRINGVMVMPFSELENLIVEEQVIEMVVVLVCM